MKFLTQALLLGVLTLTRVSAESVQAPLKLRVNHQALSKSFAQRDQEVLKTFKDIEVGSGEFQNLFASVTTQEGLDEAKFDFNLKLEQEGISGSSD